MAPLLRRLAWQEKTIPYGGWQYVFKKAGVLDKPLYMTFSTEEGDAYASQAGGAAGARHCSLGAPENRQVLTIADLIGEYLRDALPFGQG